jgi:diaminopimelate epimerase
MRIPFTKAHGAKNDFLLTWRNDAPRENLPEAARAICDRHTGVGADGWLLVSPPAPGEQIHGRIQLFNADGSVAEISGNGTRCAAAFLLDAGVTTGPEVRIDTGAGPKSLRLIQRKGLEFLFEMNMGEPVCSKGPDRDVLPLADATLIDAGNPQCAFLVEHFDFDWRGVGRQVERHPFFPNRTNVSFFRRVDRHTIEVLFWERGAGETMSSGTGSTGAAAAAIYLGLAETPVQVLTPAGPLDIRFEEGTVFLTGPAEITAGGEYYFEFRGQAT